MPRATLTVDPPLVTRGLQLTFRIILIFLIILSKKVSFDNNFRDRLNLHARPAKTVEKNTLADYKFSRDYLDFG